MGIRGIRSRYPTADARISINRGLCAEVPGARELLDAIGRLYSEVQRPDPRRTAQELADFRAHLTSLGQLLDEMRDAILRRTPDPSPPAPAAARAPAQQKGPAGAGPMSEAGSVADRNGFQSAPARGPEIRGETKLLVTSTPAPGTGATEGVLLSDLRPSIPAAPADSQAAWSADRLARLGKVPDAQLATEMGTSAESVRRKRESLGIAPRRVKTAWTEARLRVLDEEPDNARAAAKLGVSLNTVKIARSRFKRGG